MNKEIKVSIVIPVYNAQKYIVECLDSITSQTLKEIEIICINDGSTDASEETINNYKNGKIRLYTKENEGSGKARNLGIEKAKGKYIAFMDPDDLYASKDVLERMYTAAEANHAQICGGNILNFYDGEEPYLTDTYNKYHIREEGFKLSQEYQNPWGHTKYLFRKDFLEQNQLRYPEYRRGQDPVFMIKALAAAEQIYLMPITVYLYRQYKRRDRFSNKVIFELLGGYLETIKIASNKYNQNAFIDCVSQLEYWYSYIGFSEWENPYFWELIDTISMEVIKGAAKMNIDYPSNVIWKKSEVEQSAEEFCKCLKQAKEASKKNRLAIYGAGNIAEGLIKILDKFDIVSYEVVVTNKLSEKKLDGKKVQSINELDNKEEYVFFLAVASQQVQNEIAENLNRLCIYNHIRTNVERLVNMEGMQLRVEQLMGE